MAFRRQQLTQRRKAVGFTQESLAEHLGVERSTVIRWEGGDSEPLPSIRPSLARALQVSIDQLAELLKTSEDAGTAPAVAADPEETAPVLLSPEVQPGGPELDNLSHPQVAETVEALRRALRSAGVSADDLAAMLVVAGSSSAPPGAPGSDVPEPPPTESPRLPAQTALSPEPREVQQYQSGSRTAKRFAVAGVFVFALPVALLSPPLGFSHPGASLQPGARTVEAAAPVLASPELNPGGGTDHSAGLPSAPGDVNAASAVVPVDGPAALPAPAAAPAPRTSRATGNSPATRRSTRPAVTHHPSAAREWMRSATVADDRWNGVRGVDRVGRLW